MKKRGGIAPASFFRLRI